MNMVWFLEETFQVLLIEVTGVAAVAALLYGYVRMMTPHNTDK
ncbi:MAG: hypothetical protein ACI4AA_01430 [Lachnospiraceae bacterium]